MKKQAKTTSSKQKNIASAKPHVNKVALQPFPHPNLVIHPRLAKKDKLFAFMNFNTNGLLDFYKPNYGCATSLDQNKRLFNLVGSFFINHAQQAWVLGNRPNITAKLEVQVLIPPGTGIMIGANVLRFNFVRADVLSTNIRLRITINDGGAHAYDVFFPDVNSIAPFSIYLGVNRQRTIAVTVEVPPSDGNLYVILLEGIELYAVSQRTPPVGQLTW